jgi:hypothetical protein
VQGSGRVPQLRRRGREPWGLGQAESDAGRAAPLASSHATRGRVPDGGGDEPGESTVEGGGAAPPVAAPPLEPCRRVATSFPLGRMRPRPTEKGDRLKGIVVFLHRGLFFFLFCLPFNPTMYDGVT